MAAEDSSGLGAKMRGIEFLQGHSWPPLSQQLTTPAEVAVRTCTGLEAACSEGAEPREASGRGRAASLGPALIVLAAHGKAPKGLSRVITSARCSGSLVNGLQSCFSIKSFHLAFALYLSSARARVLQALNNQVLRVRN